ncbi:MAG: adenosine deaminase, partial [bacterium]
MVDKQAVKSLPKLDLHLHLDGAIRTETIRDLAREHDVEMPSYEVQELAKHVQVQPSCRNLSEFLQCFETFYPVLQYPSALERIAYELCEDLAAQGVIYAETRFA